MKKSRTMLNVEEKHGMKLEQLIQPLINELGLSGAARYLELHHSTLNYWVLKLGLRMETVAVGPGEMMEVIQVPDYRQRRG